MAESGLARQNMVVGVSTALTAISVIIVCLRLYTRAIILHNIGKDDYAMFAALVFTLGYLATIFVLRENKMGFRGSQASFEQATTTLKVTYAIESIYYISISAIKVSIVFFYLRIAVNKPFERLCKVTIALLITFCTICLVVIFTQCRPLHKMWDLTGMVQGSCINTTIFIYTTSIANILIDIFILILPLPLVLSIQRPMREKSALFAIFALGAFSCIASIVRLYSVRVFTESKDPFFASVPINTWSMVEINIGIWCASIPALKALFSKAQRVRTMRSQGYVFHGSERSGVVTTTGSRSKGRGKRNGNETGSGSGSFGTIVKNEEFLLEEIIGGREREGSGR